MPDRPFGFGPPGGGRPGSGSSGSGSSGSGSGSSGGPPDETGGASPFGPLGDPQQFADLMSWQGGPVNWDLAKNVARHAVAAEGDPSVLDVDRHKVVDALRLADLWLDEVTGFPTGVRQAQAWSRSEWVEATLPVWSTLCDPIADKAVDAMGGILAEDPTEVGAGLPEELGQALQAISGGLSGLGGMMRRIGGMMVGSQTGAAVGALAREVVSSTDVGLPLGPEGTAALLPAGVTAFGEGLSVDSDQVRLFLALRETAHHRLFAHVPWLRAHLLRAVEDYARGITVDASQLRDAMPQIDPANPEAMGGTVRRRAVPAGRHPAAEGGAGPAGDGAGIGGGLGSHRGGRGGWEPAAAGDGAGRGDPAAAGHRRPSRAYLRHSGRPGAAAAPAARGGAHLAAAHRSPRGRRAGCHLGTPGPAALAR